MNCLSPSVSALCPARSLLTALATVTLLGACSGSENTTSATTTPTSTVNTPALFAFFDSDNDGVGDSIARIDLDTDTVMKTAVVGLSGSGGTHKQAFYDGPLWVGAGALVWGIDPTTLQVLPRPVAPSIQGNREGTIGSAVVNALSLVTGFLGLGPTAPVVQTTEDAQMAALRPYFDRTSASYAEAQAVDFCAAQSARSGFDSNFTAQATQTHLLAAAITVPGPFHNMGYTPVGIEPSPDGKLTMFAERMGDQSFFLDTDPNSPTFGYPVRFIYPRLGQVKDQNNNVVSSFGGRYTPAGGTAPGRLNYNRVATGTSETDKNTYSEPCDSTALRNAAGQVWTWWPDVQGDTITGANISTLNTVTPQVVQMAVPVIARSTAAAARGGVGSAPTCPVPNTSGVPCSPSGQRAGPWMASLMNRNVGNEFIVHVENEGDNSESFWDVTNAAGVFEIERIVMDLKDVLTPDLATQTPGSPTAFTNGTTYTVSVSYISTGGAAASVNYQYVSLPGDTLSGTEPDLTRAYLKKVIPAAPAPEPPGPRYILNGLLGRAGTSEANVARIQGSGTSAILFSDEVWLLTFVGADGIQIVDMKGLAPPYLINENVALPSAFSGTFSPNGKKFYQIRNNAIDVIDTASRKLVNVITLPGPATGFGYASYHAESAPAISDGGGTSSGGGGSGGGGGLPPNPCGG
ncbi:MAG TPA: hypothetical protein VLB06_05135 [Sulfuricaulis sp.]|nr:hypothetical protein [Sulfuricaulis sp.]